MLSKIWHFTETPRIRPGTRRHEKAPGTRRQSPPRKSINQQISNHYQQSTINHQTPKFPSFFDQADVDQNNRFNPFGTHEHPSFPQTAGGKLPSIDQLKEDVHPHKLLTSDPIGAGNYDSGHGHVFDGSRKRLFLIK